MNVFLTNTRDEIIWNTLHYFTDFNIPFVL